MPLQNRVRPTGEIVADPSRAGMFMGNRGILHDATRTLGTARWRHPHWVTCRLSFKGRHRSVMTPGTYTELFFLDEAVALAAGHRPCAECRRGDYRAFRDAFEAANGPVATAAEMDRRLHAARVTRTRQQVTHEAPAETLPDGTFIRHAGDAWLILGEALLRFSPARYTDRRARPSGAVTVLTPAPSVAVLRAGYRPRLHESASA